MDKLDQKFIDHIRKTKADEIAKSLCDVQPIEGPIDWDRLAEEMAILHSMHDRNCSMGCPTEEKDNESN